MSKAVLKLLLFILVPGLAHSAPTILFSDLTAAPNTGWDSNDAAKGAVVTIWGFNFGVERAGSFVSVNGVPLKDDMDYVDTWGEKNNPVPNLESITFQLNNTIPLGEDGITLTVNNVESNKIDFNVNDGRIFFTDVNSASVGSGTLQSPWKSPNSFLTQRELGDILYFRAGTYDQIYFGGKSNIWMRGGAGNVPPRDATKLKPIAFVGYPNEIAIIDSATYGSSQFKSGFKLDASYHTVSKLTFNAYSAGVDGLHNVRIVGNDVVGAKVLVDGSGIINLRGNNGKALGNAVHGARSQDKLDHGIYISGCAPDKGNEVAWNYVYDNDFAEGPAIVVNHQATRCPSNVFVKSHKIHHNIVDCSAYATRAIGIYDLSWDPQDGEIDEPEAPLVYNNVVYKCGRAGVNFNSPSVYQNAAHGVWFNNMILDSREDAFSIDGPNFISTHVYNNIIVLADPSKKYMSAHKAGFNVDNNIYYGGGAFPGVDANAINADPQVTVDTSLWGFILDKSSPAIDAGVTIFDSGDLDINGNKRLAGSKIDIGAVEYIAKPPRPPTNLEIQ